MPDQMPVYTEEGAKTHVETLLKSNPTWFCPLIKGTCNPECWSCIKPKAFQLHGDQWHVYPYYCNSGLLNGG